MDFVKTLVLIVALFGLLAHTTAVRTPHAHLTSICKPTKNPSLCYKTILPQVGPNFNIYKALEIEVNVTQKWVGKIVKVVDLFAASLTASRHTYIPIERQSETKIYTPACISCKVLYKNIVNNVAEIVNLVSKRNVAEARIKFGAVLSDHAACDKGFGEMVSPFTQEAEAVFELSSNCLDIIKAIEVPRPKKGTKVHIHHTHRSAKKN